MMVLEPEIDPNLCRLCGKADGIKIDIFDEKHNYQKKIHSLLPIAIYEYDPLPKKMCHRCMFQVDGFYEFRENCLKTEEYLKLQLPWMPRKASNGTTDESTLNKEPMVHISSPTLNAFTMNQWFVARNMMEADDDVQIVDVFCRPRQSNDRTAISDRPEGRSLDTDGSRLTSKVNDGKAGTPNCEQNMSAEPSYNNTLLAVEGRIGKKQKESAMCQLLDLSAADAMIQECTPNVSSACTMATNTLIESSTTQSVITMALDETEKSLSNNSKKDQQHRQEQHQNIKIYTVHDEQENEVPCIVKHKGKILNKEDQDKLVVKNNKEQEKCERAEEQPWEHLQHKLQSSQEQNPLPTQAQNLLECDTEGKTIHTDSSHMTSATEDTAFLSERGIAHVRKQMKEQQKKSHHVSIGSRSASASREESPSGCRRVNPRAQQADMSGSATTKLSKINRKPGGSFCTSEAKDTNCANKKPDEGERRILAPKNVLKLTIPKNLLTDGASAVSEDVHNRICNSQENLDADNRNVNRSSKDFPKSSELKSEALEDKTLEERPGIIVTRIPAACDIYTCEACERMFVTRETAYSHMCDEGGESCNSDTETGGEIRFKAGRSTGDSERYSCCVCGQRFSRNATLAAHLKAHTKVWSESDDSDGTGILRDISTDSDDTESRGKGTRRRRRASRKTSTCPRKAVKLSLPVVV